MPLHHQYLAELLVLQETDNVGTEPGHEGNCSCVCSRVDHRHSEECLLSGMRGRNDGRLTCLADIELVPNVAT